MRKWKLTSVLLNNANIVLSLLFQALIIVVGIWEFGVTQKSIIRNDVSLKLQQRKIETYFKIGEVTGAILANEAFDSTFKRDVSKFYGLYYSEAILLDDSSLNKSMAHFRFAIHDYINCRISKFDLNNVGFQFADSLKAATHNYVIDVERK